jgi:3D (Asp-Asp-Asp) domain-containing protein
MTSVATSKMQLSSSEYSGTQDYLLRKRSRTQSRRVINASRSRLSLRPVARGLFALIISCLALLFGFLRWFGSSATAASGRPSEERALWMEHGNYASKPVGAWIGWRSLGLEEVTSTGQTKFASGPSSPLAWIKRHRAPFFSTSELKLSKSFPHKISNSSHSSVEEKIKGPVKVQTRLARITAYWPEEGDSYTKRRLSSTGVKLRDGHCAVDPKVIPYGSVVKISGMGKYVAVDTGPAVVSRRAARATARTSAERKALVVDIYFPNRSKARALEKNGEKFALVTWYR